MASAEPARQFSFRLPVTLVTRVDECMEEMRDAGLEVTRADVVRMLLKHALDATQCQLDLLIGAKKRPPARRRMR